MNFLSQIYPDILHIYLLPITPLLLMFSLLILTIIMYIHLNYLSFYYCGITNLVTFFCLIMSLLYPLFYAPFRGDIIVRKGTVMGMRFKQDPIVGIRSFLIYWMRCLLVDIFGWG